MAWITSPTDPRLQDLWPGAIDYIGSDTDFLALPLNAARIQCEAFAPTLADTDPVPDNYIAAQVLQARALVRAGIVGSGDQMGEDGQTVSVFPMDWTVKLLLRPRKGKPYFGGRRS